MGERLKSGAVQGQQRARRRRSNAGNLKPARPPPVAAAIEYYAAVCGKATRITRNNSFPTPAVPRGREPPGRQLATQLPASLYSGAGRAR